MQPINIQAYGAVGDSVTDNFTAIRQAASALQSGDELYFPPGTYRITHPGTLVEVEKVSRLTIRFAPGAELLMDNLDSQGLGSGHAFSFRGPGEGLTLDGLRVRWAVKAAKRSKGDGIRIDGPTSAQGPSAQRTLKKISITNCRIENSPQTGMVLMGCSDISIHHVTIQSTWADGIHLNACQHYTITDVVGQNLGDDNVALVTYYNPSATNCSLSGRARGPYTQPRLGEWSNYRGVVKNVRTSGKTGANGLRVAGALSVAIEQVQASKKKAAIIIDAGRKGNTFGWEYQASRGITVSGLDARNCHVGVHIMTFNVLPTDTLFWDFEVSLDNIVLEGCAHDNLLVEKCSGVTVGNVQSSRGRVRMIHLNNLTVDNLRHDQGSVVIHGWDRMIQASSAQTTRLADENSNLRLHQIVVTQGSIQLENASGIEAGKIAAYAGLGDTGVALVNLRQVSIGSLVSVMARRFGVRVINCQQLTVEEARVEGEGRKFLPLEVGGGTAASVTQHVVFRRVIYRNPRGQGKTRPSFQQGVFAPQRVSIRIEHRRPSGAVVSDHYQLP